MPAVTRRTPPALSAFGEANRTTLISVPDVLFLAAAETMKPP